MSYFGGLGAGKGWLETKFVISAAELRDLLAGQEAVLMATNGRVAADYQETPLDDYVESYRRFVEAMLSEEPVPWEVTLPLYMGISLSASIFTSEPCPDPQYKLVSAEEPVVTLGPSSIYFDGRTLYRNILTNSAANFGLWMQFPRVVSFSRERHERLHDSAQFPNSRLFADLSASIRAITSPCRIQSSARVHRTEIRISQEMRERINGHPGLRRLGLMVL